MTYEPTPDDLREMESAWDREQRTLDDPGDRDCGQMLVGGLSDDTDADDTISEKSLWADGYEAYWQGLEIEDAPRWGALAQLWVDGWYRAQDDDRFVFRFE